MIRVAVGILVRTGADGGRSVLLCQRRESAKYPLKWEFPGGKVEPGEQTADALVRELREELGVAASSLEPFHRQEAIYPDSGHYDVHYFLVRDFDGEPENRVFRRLAWVPPAELSRYDILDGNRGVVDRLLALPDAVQP